MEVSKKILRHACAHAQTHTHSLRRGLSTEANIRDPHQRLPLGTRHGKLILHNTLCTKYIGSALKKINSFFFRT